MPTYQFLQVDQGKAPQFLKESSFGINFVELQVHFWLEDHVLEELTRLGMAEANSPVLLQNFEISSLEYVASKSSLRQVFINKNNLTELDWLRLDSLPLTGVLMGLLKQTLMHV